MTSPTSRHHPNDDLTLDTQNESRENNSENDYPSAKEAAFRTRAIKYGDNRFKTWA
jgi:hypothetical protein